MTAAGPAVPGSLEAGAAFAAIPDEPRVTVSFVVNGEPFVEEVPARLHVADLLRYRLGLTGTHVGCEQGVCGMCTVIVDGLAVKSCLMLAPQLEGRSLETVESLATGDDLNDLQARFKVAHALQCGFCTPGFLMTATALARRGEPIGRVEIEEELSGVMCRCTGYESIVLAVEGHLSARRRGAIGEQRG